MTSEIEILSERLAQVRAKVAAACSRSGRGQDEVTLVGVTKTVRVEVAALAAGLGLSDLAENYARELAAKASRVAARWHFIGAMQRGTAPIVARHADVIHSAVPGHAISILAARARASGRSMPCLVQVDFTGSRQGVSPERLETAIEELTNLQGIHLEGLMTIPPANAIGEGARPYFARLRGLRDGLAGRFPRLLELSMGMSADYEVAVEEGATIVRVGTALFGARSVSSPGPGAAGP